MCAHAPSQTIPASTTPFQITLDFESSSPPCPSRHRLLTESQPWGLPLSEGTLKNLCKCLVQKMLLPFRASLQKHLKKNPMMQGKVGDYSVIVTIIVLKHLPSRERDSGSQRGLLIAKQVVSQSSCWGGPPAGTGLSRFLSQSISQSIVKLY